MAKPRVNTKCVADRYSDSNERIVEVSGQNGTGALISIRNQPDGTVAVHVYAADPAFVVTVGEAR